jgi:alanyl-tRNA synthetase
MQYDRADDGSLSPLPAPCVDTGMGLERLAAILQKVHSNYEIDLFQHLIRSAASLTGTTDLENKSLRVISDHIRACAFLIVDGVLPSNEGRGYVLRRIIRRALRHGWMLGVRGDFFWKMVEVLAAEMGSAYPELAAKRDFIERALKAEEERFGETLEQGMKVFERETTLENLATNQIVRARGEPTILPNELVVGHNRINRLVYLRSGAPSLHVFVTRLSGDQRYLAQTFGDLVDYLVGGKDYISEWVIVFEEPPSEELASRLRKQAEERNAKVSTIHRANISVIDGAVAFRLYDTYGFPVDLTADIARERGLSVDMAGFEAAMNAQRERARAASSFESRGQLPAELASSLPATQFGGYDSIDEAGARVLALVRGGRRLEALAPGEEGMVILDRTPFYAESGGQVGDSGELLFDAGRFAVSDTIKLGGAFHGHVGQWEGSTPLRPDAIARARVDAVRRRSIVLNHSATHLLHAALREVLGEHVTQKGSLVAPDRLRFDFSHFQPLAAEELRRIEDLVNDEIRANSAAEIRHMAYDDAIAFGAMALFGEKYGDEVRVLRMGDFSTELCGGTHVARTGDIGLFKILSEGGVSSGIRRIEAVTGGAAVAHVVVEESWLGEIGSLLSAQGADVVAKLRQVLDRQKKLERELESFKARAASAATADLASEAVNIDGIKVLAARVDGLDAKALREGIDALKPKLGDCVILLASGADGRISLVASVAGAATGRIKAGDIVSHVAAAIGGKGGGRADMAQGGGNDVPELSVTLAGLPAWIGAKLSG